MPDIVFKCCDNFNVKKIFFSCKGRKKKQKKKECKRCNVLFDLVDSTPKKYNNLVPQENYLYLKVLRTGKIIAISGDYLEEFNLTKKDLFHKKLDNIKCCKELFDDYVYPLFEECLNNSESYQFNFKSDQKNTIYSCSLYPCFIPEKVASVDIVFRHSHQRINKKRLSKYAI